MDQKILYMEWSMDRIEDGGCNGQKILHGMELEFFYGCEDEYNDGEKVVFKDEKIASRTSITQ